MKALLFCVGNIAALWLGARWAAGIAARRLDFLVGWVALYPLCAVLLMLGGGLAGFLHPWPLALALLAVGGGVMLKTGSGSRFMVFYGTDRAQTMAPRIAAALVAAFAAFPIVRAFTAGTGYFIDDFGYHAVAVAAWVQYGDFRQWMPQFMAYLPMNAELLSGWFALPFHHDGMVVLAGLVWLALAAVAGGGLVRRAGGDATASFLVAAAVLASPPIVWQTRTFSACDLAGAATLLAAIYFAAAAADVRRFGPAVAAGLLAGFAAGTKATFLPVAAVICLWPLVAPMPWRARFSFVAVLSLSAAASGSVWFLRNGLVTGNPLFPAEIGPFTGPLTRAEQAEINLVGLIAMVPGTPRLWGGMLRDWLDWPLPLGLFAVAGYVRALAVECLRALPCRPAESVLRRLLLAGGLAQFVLHLFAPFCLGGGYVDGRIEVYTRYIMPWFVFGLALAGPLLDGRVRFAWGWRALVAAGLAMCWPVSGFMRFGGVAVVLGALALFRGLPVRVWKPVALGGFIAVWPLLALLAPRLRTAAGGNLREHVRTEGGRSLGEALLALESLPAGTRLTRFANHAYLNAPFFGRDWQLRPVFTDAGGRALPPLHLQFAADPGLHFFRADPRPLPAAGEFVANLRAAGIDAVFVTKYGAGAWPPQQALLEESGEAAASFNDGDSALWHLTWPAP